MGQRKVEEITLNEEVKKFSEEESKEERIKKNEREREKCRKRH